jgi:hypothetical protein
VSGGKCLAFSSSEDKNRKSCIFSITLAAFFENLHNIKFTRQPFCGKAGLPDSYTNTRVPLKTIDTREAILKFVTVQPPPCICCLFSVKGGRRRA